MIVRTPRELLMKSSSLSAKHQNLRDQILTMESDIYFLDEKYKKMVRIEWFVITVVCIYIGLLKDQVCI